MRDSILNVARHAKLLGVPVNYGEYGVGRADKREERNTDIVREYYKTIVETTIEQGISSSVGTTGVGLDSYVRIKQRMNVSL